MSEPASKPAPKPAALLIVGLLGLAGLVYLIWPKPALIERSEPSVTGAGWELRPDKVLIAGPTMGTSYSVILTRDADGDGQGFESAALDELLAQVEAELVAVNAEMSTYLPDSQISQFNAAPVGQAVQVSGAFIELLELSRELHAASEGAFDVTIGPLVDVWGFGPDPRTRTEPSAEQIEQLRASMGLDKLTVDPKAATLSKAVAGLRVDLSAIAKGHGVDRVAARLDAAGYANYMVEIGGEVRARGQNPAGEAWRIGVEKPSEHAADTPVVQQLLRVSEVAVATSGDYRNYWELEGVRYSHTLDARTGRPISHRLASVTVVHPESAALADGWATTLNVLGPERGLELAEQQELAAYFLVRREDGSFEARASSAFARYE